VLPGVFCERLTVSCALRACGVDLISDALPFGRLWYGKPDAISNAIDYAKFRSRSHRAVIRVYDAAGNVIETHREQGRVQRVVSEAKQKAATR
jgi:YD repeat-containing protein